MTMSVLSRIRLAAIFAAACALLTACGGGNSGDAASAGALTSAAAEGDSRRQALAAPANTPEATPDAVTDAVATPTDVLTQCAIENQFCAFSGTRDVVYGTATANVRRSITNGVACNNSVFGDPAVGVLKTCWIDEPAASTVPSGFAQCATENQFCAFSGVRDVIYGTATANVRRSITNGVACTNAVFGDPAVGAQKTCWYDQQTASSIPANFVQCAVENQFCAFAGVRDVIYGTATANVRRSITNGVACTNGVFGDPAPGSQKTCWYDQQTVSGIPANFVQCAVENQFCAFSGVRDVIYGTTTANVRRSITNGVACSNAVFGDPAPALQKTCWYDSSVVSAPAPAPAPAPISGPPGAGYFVDAVAGNDSNAGSYAAPFKTLRRLSGLQIPAGQSIYLQCGGTWRESLTIGVNAMIDRIAEGATISGYGDCASKKATISGADDYSGGWTKSGNVWSRRIPAGTPKISRLFTNGTPLRTAQWPNFGGIRREYAIAVDSSPHSNTVLNVTSGDASTLAGKDVAGAVIMVRTEPYAIERRNIASLNGATLNVTPATYHDMEGKDGFVLQDKQWMLDAAGEFYHDTGSNTLYIYPPDSGTQNNLNSALVEGSVREQVLKIADRPRIGVSNIAAVMSREHGIGIYGAPGTTLDSVEASHNQVTGVFVSIESLPSGIARGATIKNSSIVDNWLTGIDANRVPSVEIAGNQIADTGMLGFAGWSDGTIKAAPGAIVDRNTITQSAHMAIAFSSVGGSRITNNIVSGYCLRLSDCSGIYTVGVRGLGNQSSLLEGNQVLGATPNMDGASGGAPGLVVGIYLDDYANGVTMNNNLVLGVNNGLYIHNGSNHTVTNNKFWLTTEVGLMAIMDRPDADFMTGNVFRGNQFVPSVAINGSYPNLPFGGASLAISFVHILRGNSAFASGSNLFTGNQIVPLFGASMGVASAGGLQLTIDGWRSLNPGEASANPPVTFAPYSANVGPELMPNGEFDNGLGGWTAWLQSGGSGGSANAVTGVNGCNGPCVTFRAGRSGDMLISSGFRMTAGVPHIIKYTAVMGGTGTFEEPFLSRNGAPWEWFAGPEGYATVSPRSGNAGDIVRYEGMFKPISSDEARLNMMMTAGVPVSFDSVSVKRVIGYSVPSTADLAVAAHAPLSASLTASCSSLGWPSGCTAVDSGGGSVSLPVSIPAGGSRLFLRTDTSWRR